MSASTIRTLMAAAQAAIASNDWTTAKGNAEQALALLVSMPDGASSSHSQQWNREALERFIKHCEKREVVSVQSSAGNSIFGVQKFKYVSPTD